LTSFIFTHLAVVKIDNRYDHDRHEKNQRRHYNIEKGLKTEKMKKTTSNWISSLLLVLGLAHFVTFAHGAFCLPPISSSSSSSSRIQTVDNTNRNNGLLLAAPSDGMVDANKYNIELEEAVDLWTASVKADPSPDREPGVPYLDSKSKNYYVDDLQVTVSRNGGMGMQLLELAGGRDDGFGITIITAVSGNANKAGVLPGDSISAVAVRSMSTAEEEEIGLSSREEVRFKGCECLDFDNTMDILANFPGESSSSVTLSLKRLRRWPKIQLRVEYPPSQCAEGVNNIKELELFAGENLKQAMLNRGIILDDPKAPMCDFCGGKCNVRVLRGMPLLNPIGMTEKKIMARNPACRVRFYLFMAMFLMDPPNLDLELSM
jgi:hypothetical protein